MSPRRKNPAEKEMLVAKSYDLAVKGESYRSIASKLGINHKTVASYVVGEAQRRSNERSRSSAQLNRDARRKLTKLLFEEIEKIEVSAHAKSQLGHAISNLLDSLDKLEDHFPANRVKLDANVSMGIEDGLGVLSQAEMGALEVLYMKICGDIPRHVNIIPVILDRHQRRILHKSFDKAPLELPEEEVVEAEVVEGF